MTIQNTNVPLDHVRVNKKKAAYSHTFYSNEVLQGTTIAVRWVTQLNR